MVCGLEICAQRVVVDVRHHIRSCLASIVANTKRELRLHTRGGMQLAKLRFKAKKATEEKLSSQLDVFAAVKY
ncbi:hypothetical protein Sjap_004955 [Stephania japonica]|uniref:Uncharacterized protein n=1 Tax=Stephania japonica TaxID=461633 RepID=A0AAP0K5F5_9MAGN